MLLNIEFRKHDKKALNIDEIKNRLRDNVSSSILIINRPALTAKDFVFCEKTLSKIGLKIIITTLTKTIPKNFTVLNVDNRPVSILKEIFLKYYPDSDFTDDEFQTLLENISNNVYVLSLIGKTLSNGKNALEKDKVLKISEDLSYIKNTYKVHSSYHDSGTKSGQFLLNLVGRILDNYDLELLNIYASELSVWAKTPISEKILITKWDKTVIKDCIMYGILQYYDESKEKLFIPSLIADVIWNQYPIDYNEYKEKISTLLTDIEYGKSLSVSYPDLYQIIFNMILRFHFQISTMCSRPKKNDLNVFKDWNMFLTEIIERYMKLGNYQYAQNVLPYLYAPRSNKGETILPSNLQSVIRELLYKQANYMQSQNISEALDGLIAFIKDFRRNSDFSGDDMKIILYLCLLICKDMAEQVINTTLNLLSNECITENWLIALENLSALLAGKDDYYAYLLSLTYHYTSVIVKPDCLPDHLYEIVHHKELFLSEVNPSYEYFRELIFCFKGLCIYFDAILYLQYIEHIIIEPTETLESRYNALYSEFKESLWPYHVSYIFYACTFLFVTYLLPFCHKDSTIQSLKNSMRLCKSFNHKQLSLSSEEAAEYDKLIDAKIKELDEYMSPKNKNL